MTNSQRHHASHARARQQELGADSGGERAASVPASGSGLVWEVPGGEPVAPFLDLRRKEMTCAALSPKGTELAVGTEDYLQVFRVSRGNTQPSASHHLVGSLAKH